MSATNRTGPYQQFVLPIGTSEIHEDLWEIDRKLNLLAEKILTIDERLDEAQLDKRESRRVYPAPSKGTIRHADFDDMQELRLLLLLGSLASGSVDKPYRPAAPLVPHRP